MSFIQYIGISQTDTGNIDSREYISWERFFTALLRECTVDDRYKQYNKSDIPEFYTQGKNADRILSVMPGEIRELL